MLYSGSVCMWREGLTAVLCSDSVCMWREGLTAVLYSGSAGPYAAFLKGGLHGDVAQTGMLWALAHSPPRGVWGHASPENLEI